jgi:hypothetical protein
MKPLLYPLRNGHKILRHLFTAIATDQFADSASIPRSFSIAFPSSASRNAKNDALWPFH